MWFESLNDVLYIWLTFPPADSFFGVDSPDCGGVIVTSGGTGGLDLLKTNFCNRDIFVHQPNQSLLSRHHFNQSYPISTTLLFQENIFFYIFSTWKVFKISFFFPLTKQINSYVTNRCPWTTFSFKNTNIKNLHLFLYLNTFLSTTHW